MDRIAKRKLSNLNIGESFTFSSQKHFYEYLGKKGSSYFYRKMFSKNKYITKTNRTVFQVYM
jgi:hypothetical protein